MARRVYVETAQPGLTATDRRVAVVSAGDLLAAPTLSSDGVAILGVETIHVLTRVTGGTFNIRLWWYSTISGQWHAGEAPLFGVVEDTLLTVESLGLERVAIEVSSSSGGPGEFTAWIGRVVPA